MSLWEEILWVWIVMTILPKLVIVPIWHFMWKALHDTKRQDEIDAAWLAGLGNGGGGGGTTGGPSLGTGLGLTGGGGGGGGNPA